MIVLLDNYDSFTYNLYQYLSELGVAVTAYRNDRITIDEVLALAPRAVVISPGPGLPASAGITKELITACAEQRLPLLGVCLGHQALGEVFGAQVVAAKTLMHGKTSVVRHDGKTLFAGLPQSLTVMRYHSLVLQGDSIPEEVFEISAVNTGDGEVMAMRHRRLPFEGVQFHPESIMTEQGKPVLKNFIDYYL